MNNDRYDISVYIRKKAMRDKCAEILIGNILPFWMRRMVDNERGGFYGRIDGNDVLHADADKGAILNARILWAFSASYRVLSKYDVMKEKCAQYLATAKRARTYIIDHFIDKKHGGVYWSIDCEGNPSDSKKQTYAIAFTIYGLAEYARALKTIGDESLNQEYDETIDLALRLADDIETHAFDAENNGYIEALSEDWQPIGDMRLSDKDENGSRTMNTHLHVLEAYTNLIRAVSLEKLQSHPVFYPERVENLVNIFTGIIMNEDGHLDLFFNDQWEGNRNIQSYGHDIEGAWLLHEAVLVLEEVTGKKMDIDNAVINIARASERGYCGVFNLMYEKNLETGETDESLQWWVQCENVVGHADLFQYFGADYEYDLNVAFSNLYGFMDSLLDKENGEWHWSLNPDGTVNYADDKAGFWKCPYHNSRMCLEIIERDIPCEKYEMLIEEDFLDTLERLSGE